ncbi:MAG TPA: hypothetical protein VMZ50_14170 [Phycisphaerae bacterium]|nr:hypothetical protein [Phycisphaerae bacterium]
MGKASYARSGQAGGGNISKARKARGDVEKGKPFEGAATPFGGEGGDEDDVTTPGEPVTKSSAAVLRARGGDLDVEKAGGVPDAIGGPSMGAFARGGNAGQQNRAVSVQTGLGSIGPSVAAAVARGGGQVQLAPGQIGVWAHPKDPTSAPLRKPSTQYGDGNPEPAKPVY